MCNKLEQTREGFPATLFATAVPTSTVLKVFVWPIAVLEYVKDVLYALLFLQLNFFLKFQKKIFLSRF